MQRASTIVALAIVSACSVEATPAIRRPHAPYPTLEPDGRIGAVPIDPYGPEPVLAMRGLVGDHVPSDVEFGDPSTVTKMVVKVKSAYRLPSTPNHRVAVDHDIQRVTIHVGPGTPVTRAESVDALRSTAMIDANELSIRRSAHQATSGLRTDRQRVAALVSWTHSYMTYEHADVTVASTVLARGRGDCSEFSLLFVALARATGIPARRVVGLAATEIDLASAFGFHAWAEVALDGHWVQVDPTWNEPVADATHLVLVEGDGDEWSKAVDDLHVAVVDLEHDKTFGRRADARQLTRELPAYLRLRRR